MHNVFHSIKQRYRGDLEAIDALIKILTESEAPLIGEVVNHIVNSGGKRLRPLLTTLCATMLGYQGKRHIELATCVEFLHTATLLHDDVVDDSKLRRGKLTANTVWNNAASVLVGDFLLSKSFEVMAQDGDVEVLRIIAESSAIISQGEVKQLSARNDISTTEETYFAIIQAKTAQLFAAACHVGAVIGNSTEQQKKALHHYGMHLGIAFQLMDDALDYAADQDTLGKHIGDDLREGKMTLPIILAYQQSTKEEQQFWQSVIHQEVDLDEQTTLQKTLELVMKYNTLQTVKERAESYAQAGIDALSIFPDHPVKTDLETIIRFAVSRNF